MKTSPPGSLPSVASHRTNGRERGGARRHGPGRALTALLGFSAALTLSMMAGAADPIVHVKASAKHQALSVGVHAGALVAKACAQAPCALDGGVTIPVNDTFSALIASATISEIALGKGSSAAMVVINDPSTKLSWVSLVAAPSKGDAKVIFSDVAHPRDELGATEPNVISVSRDAADPQVLVGTRSDALSLCGRPAMLSPKVVDPTDLDLKPVRLQRLDHAERVAAPLVNATRSSDAKKPIARLLSTAGASSAIGSPAALTDGDIETTWSEGRGAEGRGEFAVMRAPKEVTLTSLRLTFRPKTKAVEGGAAPQVIWVAVDGALIQVQLPEDGWKTPGASYDVVLPKPVATSCVAVVLDDAFVEKDAKQVAVTVAEVEAFSSFDGASDLNALVAMLDAGDDQAKAAAAVLSRGGEPARKAIAAGFRGLNERGVKLVLDALDPMPCEDGAPIHALALGAKPGPLVERAAEKLRRCGKNAAPALIAAADDKSHPARVRAAGELALAAPDLALRWLVKQHPDDAPTRRGFLGAMNRASQSSRGSAALAALLADGSLTPAEQLSLLKGGGKRLIEPDLIAPASKVLVGLIPTLTSFEERYRALEPAARLAVKGNPEATRFLAQCAIDPEPHLRAEAIKLAGAVAGLRSQVVAAAKDPDPRVREAMAKGLIELDDAAGRAALIAVFGDEWTFVRSAAYTSLGAAGPDGSVDEALIKALEKDRSSISIGAAIDALAQRKILGASKALRKLVNAKERGGDVRARAATGLGGICDRSSIDLLTDLAKEGSIPMADADTQVVASAAIAALGKLHPADLTQRLSSVKGEGPGASLRAMAIQSALDERDICP